MLSGLSTQATNATSMDSWAYGGPANDYTYGFVPTNDGGYMMVGSTCSYGAGASDVWLIKVDAHGNMVWNKTFGGPFTDYGCNVVTASDGGYVLVGYTCFDNASGIYEAPDALLIKVDADGNMLWNQTYGKAQDADYALTVAVTTDGGYVLAGAKYPNVTGTEEGWVVKVDVNGNLQWEKTFPKESGNSFFWSVVTASDGGYALAGQTPVEGNDDAWIVKIDANGNEQWSKTYGGQNSDLGWWIIRSPDGGYAVSGSTASYGAGKTDFWLLKLDENCDKQWSQTYGGPDEDIGYVITATPDGGYAIVGSTLSYGTAGSADFWLIKTDKNGKLLWNQTCGGPDYDQGQCLSVTTDGTYAIAGVTASYGAGASDGWLIISNAFDTAAPSASDLPVTQQASMQTIVITVAVVIALIAALLVVFKKRR
jgi:hypothetical protein